MNIGYLMLYTSSKKVFTMREKGSGSATVATKRSFPAE